MSGHAETIGKAPSIWPASLRGRMVLFVAAILIFVAQNTDVVSVSFLGLALSARSGSSSSLFTFSER